MDKIRNAKIKKKLKLDSLKNIIENRQLNWWKHMIRMPKTSLAKGVWNTKGIPKSWNKQMAGLLKEWKSDWNRVKDVTSENAEVKTIFKKKLLDQQPQYRV